ncbi:MAG: hypothetical protein H7Y38_13550 [Armatimonadetes bacterium]|nr:hypothetical protein [Armatimonadota bacterium]
MISGFLREDSEKSKSPWVSVTVHGFNGRSVTHDALIDTGFSGTMSLLPADVATLGLSQSGVAPTTLADGSLILSTLYFASVEWDGIRVLTQVVADGDVPLVGMKLLAGYNLSVDVTDNGKVEIMRLVPLRYAAPPTDEDEPTEPDTR